MCQPGVVNEDRASAARRIEIHRAAVEQFSKRGFAGTSMIHIAEAAGLSRPALYQYFKNKEDVFASALVAVFEQRADAALGALTSDMPLEDRIGEFLQRFEGDLWETLAATDYADEIVSAKSDVVAAAVGAVVERLWSDVQGVLSELCDQDDLVHGWRDLLRLGPKGYLTDAPSVEVFRKRLATLARTVAADIVAHERMTT